MDWHSDRGGEAGTRIRILDRLSALVAHPKRILVAIVALLVAAGAAVGSSAVLTSSSTNPGNSFQASNLDVSNDSGGFVANVSGLHPGDSIPAKTITVTNTGDLPASMDLSSSVISDTAPNGGHIVSALTLTITDVTNGGSTVIYTGAATPMSNGTVTEPITLPGTPGPQWAPSEAHQYQFQLAFPSTADNAFQLSTATIRYSWRATQ